MSTPPAHPRIPYGEADFRRIRLNRWLYVDKTRFLRRLEEERYAFLMGTIYQSAMIPAAGPGAVRLPYSAPTRAAVLGAGGGATPWR